MEIHGEPMGEHDLLLRFGEGIDLATNVRVHDARACLLRARWPDLVDAVPAYASLLLRFRPDASHAEAADPADDRLRRVRQVLLGVTAAPATGQGSPHRIPVCYGGVHGQDLATVARRLGLSEDAVVERHSAPEYRVAMLGFAPGFAYLLGMDPSLRVPRHAEPRTRVPRGSVAIGGAQTGIYPSELPGGWQLIGRTPLVMFDPADAERPCRLAPGDRVRFEPIDDAGFARATGQDA